MEGSELLENVLVCRSRMPLRKSSLPLADSNLSLKKLSSTGAISTSFFSSSSVDFTLAEIK